MMRLTLLAIVALGVACESATAQVPQTLSLHDAEVIALQNHPQIQAAQNLASAAKEQTTEIRSNYYPIAYGSITGVESDSNSRIAAGGLNNPIIFDRYANGITVGQLVADFGRTHELVKSSSLRAQAQQEAVTTSRADVLRRVDEAYFAALKGQAVLQVARQTVQARQVVADQIRLMASNQLKSDLDASFAQVDLSQAQLLLIQAENNVQASFAELSSALGSQDQRAFTLMDEPIPGPPPANMEQSINDAFQNRPELVSERLYVESLNRYAAAERDLYLPTISAVATAGVTPVRQDTLGSHYAAAGFNVNIPIFNGHLFGARRSEAAYRAQAEQQNLRDLQDRIARNVRTAWLGANSEFQRLAVTDQLLAQASQALNLAQARYNLGLSSIVELSQAQLNVTEAQIAQASAKYDYQSHLSELNYEVGNLH